MSQGYIQNPVVNSTTRFTAAPMSDLEFSRMTAAPVHITTMDAGSIVPIYYREVLPHEAVSLSVDAVIRQNTVSTPTFGNMECDIYAFFVPNRIVNESWKNVMGENSSGAWIAPEVSLVPLYSTRSNAPAVQIPVGSVADYYGFPTQAPIPAVVLQMCNDLKFRGYLEIYNTRFRDQNYQPPIPYSKLNVYEGFLEAPGNRSLIPSTNNPSAPTSIPDTLVADGSAGAGAVVKAVYGDGNPERVSALNLPARATSWSALQKPLKANKLHDYFTSVLPSPLKGPDVVFNINATLPVTTATSALLTGPHAPIRFVSSNVGSAPATRQVLSVSNTNGEVGNTTADGFPPANLSAAENYYPNNLQVDLSNAVGISVEDLRYGAAVQQVYEILARGGSRYREYINSFFGLDVDDPFCDIPRYLGHIRRNLDLYQTAQTSPSVEDSTPQGNLAAFGYTATGGALFQSTFVEHGYIHVFAVIRHRNLYASYLSRDNFRLNTLDFYTPPLANISEQPVYTREINPFAMDTDAVFGYQEAWAEYRMEQDFVTGYMRPGIKGSLALWNYADEFDSTLEIADEDWLKSNSAEVLDRTLAVTSEQGPQFKALFRFTVDKELPMPTYSVPGLDII